MSRSSTPHLLRRHLLVSAAAAGVSLPIGRVLAQPRFDRNPFGLGVASGEPTPDGFVIWTRVLVDPLAPPPPFNDAYLLVYHVAEDPDFKRIVHRAEILALPQDAHSVHVEVRGLQPARDYWYRFALHPGHVSPTGRARTAPAPGARRDRVDLVVASCQHYEAGFYGAWRDAVRDTGRPLDAILFLGDYIYEASMTGLTPRRHDVRANPVTLDDYRRRYALYRSDPDLQAAHAAAPWLVVWDDHEVENDYAGAQSQGLMARDKFLAMRAAAYRAWWEHMPVRPALRPDGANATIYRRISFGDLARIDLLDGRQYRGPQPCPSPGRGGGHIVGADCEERLDPARSLLGAAQEQWLFDGFRDGGARWNLIGNQTLMAPFDFQLGPGELRRTDSWDGYPVARDRLLTALRESRLINPVVLTGDFHTHVVADLRDAAGKTIASEFAGTSISSATTPRNDAWVAARLVENPHVRLFHNRHRGHLAVSITRERLLADLRIVDDVSDRMSPARSLKRFAVASGKPGAVPA
jgi:alkaline phosphatase D